MPRSARILLSPGTFLLLALLLAPLLLCPPEALGDPGSAPLPEDGVPTWVESFDFETGAATEPEWDVYDLGSALFDTGAPTTPPEPSPTNGVVTLRSDGTNGPGFASVSVPAPQGDGATETRGIAASFGQLVLGSGAGRVDLALGMLGPQNESFRGALRNEAGAMSLEIQAAEFGMTPVFAELALSPLERSIVLAASSFSLSLEHAQPGNLATLRLLGPGGLDRALTLPLGSVSIPNDAGASVFTDTFSFSAARTISVDVGEVALYRRPLRTFVVDALSDATDATPGDGLCATAGPAPTCTLRAAIQEANHPAGASVPPLTGIALPPGAITLALAGTGEDAAATGDLDVTGRVIVRGAGPETSFVDADTTDRVFELPDTAPEAVLVLRDVGIHGGLADQSPLPGGGGVKSHGHLFVDHALLFENEANFGGAIANFHDAWIERSTLSANQAINVFAEGRGSAITGPDRTWGASGDVYTRIRRSSIVANDGPPNGAVEASGDALVQDVRLQIEHSSIHDNTGTQLRVADARTRLDHVTLAGDLGASATLVVDDEAPLALTGVIVANTIVRAPAGGDACALLSTDMIRVGHNASDDTSCLFSATGSVEGVPLLLGAGTSVGIFQFLEPDPLLSPVVDAADAAFCQSPTDLRGLSRPVDSDADGTPGCEIGAVEAPEAGFALGLGAGALLLASVRSRRASAGRRQARRSALA
ncbi:MAG: hypothetical protein AAGC67_16895 [Myxococcota bacterium]